MFIYLETFLNSWFSFVSNLYDFYCITVVKLLLFHLLSNNKISTYNFTHIGRSPLFPLWFLKAHLHQVLLFALKLSHHLQNFFFYSLRIQDSESTKVKNREVCRATVVEEQYLNRNFVSLSGRVINICIPFIMVRSVCKRWSHASKVIFKGCWEISPKKGRHGDSQPCFFSSDC